MDEITNGTEHLNFNNKPERNYVPTKGCDHLKELDPMIVAQLTSLKKARFCVVCGDPATYLCVSGECCFNGGTSTFCKEEHHYFDHCKETDHSCFFFLGKNVISCPRCGITMKMQKWVNSAQKVEPVVISTVPAFDKDSVPLPIQFSVICDELINIFCVHRVAENLRNELNSHQQLQNPVDFMTRVLHYFHRFILYPMFTQALTYDPTIQNQRFIHECEKPLDVYKKCWPKCFHKFLQFKFKGKLREPNNGSENTEGLIEIVLSLEDTEIENNVDVTETAPQYLSQCIYNTLNSMMDNGSEEMIQTTLRIKMVDINHSFLVKLCYQSLSAYQKNQKTSQTDFPSDELLQIEKASQPNGSEDLKLFSFITHDPNPIRKHPFRTYFRDERSKCFEYTDENVRECSFDNLNQNHMCALFYCRRESEINMRLHRETFLIGKYSDTCYLMNRWLDALQEDYDVEDFDSNYIERILLYAAVNPDYLYINDDLQFFRIVRSMGNNATVMKDIHTNHLKHCFKCSKKWAYFGITFPTPESKELIMSLDDSVQQENSLKDVPSTSTAGPSEPNIRLNSDNRPRDKYKRDLLKTNKFNRKMILMFEKLRKTYRDRYLKFENVVAMSYRVPIEPEDDESREHRLFTREAALESTKVLIRTLEDSIRSFYYANNQPIDENTLEKKMDLVLGSVLPIGLETSTELPEEEEEDIADEPDNTEKVDDQMNE